METVKKNLLLIPTILSVINVICLASFLIGLSVMNHPISSILTDLGLLCPLIATSSFFYLMIKVKKHSALKYFHFVNAVTFLVPICILTFLILRFLNDWDIYF
ncbi:hypothetical protein [Peribacillus frigoritolerans]|uniref:hypothetical protein n=1 Tax=Peribacillus frigoritolerans TaxID=450367 RepID=UPI0007BF0C9B|nr:hypothetical protein [Peribacillus frigoritolerans]MCK2017927.1 hypothetical protein [Peribacillus frigoritolerans]WHY16282.1 hypothetical protein QNH16_11920 [Peribacillus frigoritolerans]